MNPLVFAPFLRPQPWGHQRFARRLHRELPAEGRFGESWELSAHPHHESVVVEGPYAGQTLPQLWEKHRAEWWGPTAPVTFPWLVKYLDCHEYLSVQVHPSDELASQFSQRDGGKTEAWVVLEAEPTARIFAGFKPDVTLGEVTERMADGSLAECLHSFAPQAGDCIFIPAGTVHAVGGGVLMVEVQQTSDSTFRLFDWNRVGLDGRPRTLHHHESLTAIDWAAGPVAPVKPVRFIDDDTELAGELLVSCAYFQWKRFHLERETVVPQRVLSVWILLEGDALVQGENYERRVTAGDTLLMPPSPFPWTWKPLRRCTLLRVDPGVECLDRVGAASSDTQQPR